MALLADSSGATAIGEGTGSGITTRVDTGQTTAA